MIFTTIYFYFLGESIPIRVFLAGYDLSPTMKDINKKFSVRYYLNLVLMDTEDRRYFKQQEITLWRKGDKQRKNMQSPMMSGTQNFNSEMQKQLEAETESIHSESDTSDQKGDNQIQSMTRETDDSQPQNNSEVANNCSEWWM